MARGVDGPKQLPNPSRSQARLPTSAPTRDVFARTVATAGLVVSLFGGWIQWEKLQDDRAAAMKFVHRGISGGARDPHLTIIATNLVSKPIRGASIGAALKLLSPERIADIFDDMPVKAEDFEVSGSEPQNLSTGKLSDDQVKRWRSGELVLVGAAKVSWRDRGAWTDSSAERCWAWIGEPARVVDCEDLTGLGASEAREHVQGILSSAPPHPRSADSAVEAVKRSTSHRL